MELKTMLRTLSEAVGVAGNEGESAAVALDLLKPLGPCEVTPLGSVICRVKPAAEGKPHILLDAHIDEIGLIVTSILDDGFIKVSNCGGIDRRVLPASQVTIHGRQPVKAVVCSVPPHLQDGEERKVQKIEEFSLDAGLTAEAAKELICPGDRVTLDTAFRELLSGTVMGKCLDDRAGCAAVIRAGELLRQEGPQVGVTVALSTLEETGSQGAQTAAYQLAPTHAFVVDVSFAHCPGVPKHKTAALGSGPMIGFAPILSGEMSRGLVECAKAHGMAHTCEVMGGRTGTNSDCIAASRAGVRVGMLSIPQRNMHSPVEIVAPADVEAVAQLIAAYVRDNF